LKRELARQVIKWKKDLITPGLERYPEKRGAIQLSSAFETFFPQVLDKSFLQIL
jgi:hypothetical protein